MKSKTLTKFKNNIMALAKSSLSKEDFEQQNHLTRRYFKDNFYRYKQHYEGKNKPEDYNVIIDLCNKLIAKTKSKNVNLQPPAGVSVIRDENNKINLYSYNIKCKGKDLIGVLSREEMEDVYQLYSMHGLNLTRREVSRYFQQFDINEFISLLEAFQITKASYPFAPHMMEEMSEEDLVKAALIKKESNVLRSIESEGVRMSQQKVKDLMKENIQLKTNLESFNAVAKEFFGNKVAIQKEIPEFIPNNEKTLILHLFDLHIGAKVSADSIYENQWDANTIIQRFVNLISRIPNNTYNRIIINLGGDLVDGMDNQTARRDHFMPQNMDNMDQVKSFLNIMEFVFLEIAKKCITGISGVYSYSVPCGNHDGTFGYVLVKALYDKLTLMYGFNCTLFDKFFGCYSVGTHKFVMFHGKDNIFMKRGFPSILDDNTKIKMYDWLDDNEIYGKNIHIIKGDLHYHAITECYRFDYRNVPSIFGASDYSMMNYQRQPNGVAFEVIENEILTRGVFNNL